MRVADLDAVLAIQQECPEAAQWSRAAYERAVESLDGWAACVLQSEAPSGTGIRLRRTCALVRGFVVIRHVVAECEILNLAVAPVSRRLGLASQLLAEALGIARSSGARRVFLEVRAGNRAAIAFYEHHGFRASGRRPGYYRDPAEDALVLARDLVCRAVSNLLGSVRTLC